MSNIGFKEWAIICESLGSGRQSIILRKGGIAEGREGFRFKHERFFLFPTLFHEQISKTILAAETPLPTHKAGKITITHLAQAEWSNLITDLQTAKRLAPLHIWNEQVVEERFNYDEPKGLNVAFIRVFKLSRPWIFDDAPKYGGCRSWVDLPEMPTDIELEPVLDDASHQIRAKELRKLLA